MYEETLCLVSIYIYIYIERERERERERDEVTGEWRKLHNKKFRDLYSSPSIIRII
jgi:hypothetical protein